MPAPDLHIIWSEDKTQTPVKQIDEARLDAAILALDARVTGMDHQLVVRSFTSPAPTRTLVPASRDSSALRRPLEAVAGVL